MSNQLKRIDPNDGTVLRPTDSLAINHESTPIIAAELQRRRGLLARIFPSKTDQEMFRNHLALVRTNNEFVEKTLDLFCRVRFIALQQVYQDYLVRGAAKITAERSAFIMQEKARLSDEINRIARQFITAMDIELESLDRVKSLALRQAEERRILADIEAFQETVARVMRDFREVLEIGAGALERTK